MHPSDQFLAPLRVLFNAQKIGEQEDHEAYLDGGMVEGHPADQRQGTGDAEGGGEAEPGQGRAQLGAVQAQPLVQVGTTQLRVHAGEQQPEQVSDAGAWTWRRRNGYNVQCPGNQAWYGRTKFPILCTKIRIHPLTRVTDLPVDQCVQLVGPLVIF